MQVEVGEVARDFCIELVGIELVADESCAVGAEVGAPDAGGN